MMNVRQLVVVLIAATAVIMSFAAPLPAAGAPPETAVPDFTKGDAIPTGAEHDWNLGATGTRGWMYSDKMAAKKHHTDTKASANQSSVTINDRAMMPPKAWMRRSLETPSEPTMITK